MSLDEKRAERGWSLGGLEKKGKLTPGYSIKKRRKEL